MKLKDLNIGLNIKISADSVGNVINGKIIALCQQKATDKGQVFMLGDKALLCHGHGILTHFFVIIFNLLRNFDRVLKNLNSA